MPEVKGNDPKYVADLEQGKFKLTQSEYLGWLDGLHTGDTVFVKVHEKEPEASHLLDGLYQIVDASMKIVRLTLRTSPDGTLTADFDRDSGTLSPATNKRILLAKLWPSQKAYELAPKKLKGH